ncbi:hypothetical protein Fcan01_00287 [Folsomia candida]|uniref:CCHC-type domain-containing protein n=1 Tax=Folsomia candida TaxID=158441 RepID=A0A226F3R5_FOLCA|nr:hypothetical protein Fcan01_00287 [Folsomia candida]
MEDDDVLLLEEEEHILSPPQPDLTDKLQQLHVASPPSSPSNISPPVSPQNSVQPINVETIADQTTPQNLINNDDDFPPPVHSSWPDFSITIVNDQKSINPPVKKKYRSRLVPNRVRHDRPLPQPLMALRLGHPPFHTFRRVPQRHVPRNYPYSGRRTDLFRIFHPNGSNTPVCYFCRQSGHVQLHCPQNPQSLLFIPPCRLVPTISTTTPKRWRPSYLRSGICGDGIVARPPLITQRTPSNDCPTEPLPLSPPFVVVLPPSAQAELKRTSIQPYGCTHCGILVTTPTTPQKWPILPTSSSSSSGPLSAASSTHPLIPKITRRTCLRESWDPRRFLYEVSSPVPQRHNPPEDPDP